jgi:hypothetical protein
MITASNYDSFDTIKTISGLTHSDLNELLNKGIELTLFDIDFHGNNSYLIVSG